jgi:hypothetical protein
LESQFKPAETLHVVKNNIALVTSDLFAAFLACPFKCFLNFKGEIPTGNDYTNWHTIQTESYRSQSVNRLTIGHPREMGGTTLDLSRWTNDSWHFALDQTVRTQEFEAHLQAVQRTQVETKIPTAQFVPLRFVPNNKLSSICGFAWDNPRAGIS